MPRRCLTAAASTAYAASACAAAEPRPWGRRSSCRRWPRTCCKDLDANRAVYTKDPQKLRELVDKYLLPHFDIEYAARLVLGKHWRTATPAQRKRFVDAFYQSLMRNYGDALARVHERSTEDPAVQGRPGGERARPCAPKSSASNGTPRARQLQPAQDTPQGWKAWDVTIEGISYVKNFRTDFGSEIDEKGLDAVIQRLEAQNAKPTAASAQKTSS